MIPTLTVLLNGVLIVAILVAVRAWYKSKTVLLTYARRLAELDESLHQVTLIKGNLQEQHRKLQQALNQAEQILATSQTQSSDTDPLFGFSPSKRTLN